MPQGEWLQGRKILDIMDKIHHGLLARRISNRSSAVTMQKDIFKEDYFGTLMCILVDESRKLLPKFNPTAKLHKIQNDMCKAGSWIDLVPPNTIIQSVPQESVQKLQTQVLPEYRRLAVKLIEHCIDSFKDQGGDIQKIQEHLGKMYKWKK